MADKRFSDDFVRWIGLLTGNERLMIEKSTTGEEFYIDFAQIANYIIERVLTTGLVLQQPLSSITSQPDFALAIDEVFFDNIDKHLYKWNGETWQDVGTPSAGVIYVFDSKNYLWNGTDLFEAGSGGGGEVSASSVAAALAQFSNTLNVAEYDKLYLNNQRQIEIGALVPVFSDYFAQKETGVTPPEAEAFAFSSTVKFFTVTDSTADNVLLTCNYAGCSVALPNLSADKMITFSLSKTSNQPVTIAGTAYATGVIVQAFFKASGNQWTVTSSLDPVIPDYSDISARWYSESNVTVNGRYLVDYIWGGVAAGDLVFLNPADKTKAGVYKVYAADFNGDQTVTVLDKVIDGTKLNVVRVAATSTVYYSMYDGTDISSLLFRSIKDVYSKAEVDSKLNEVKQLAYAAL